MAWIVRPTVSDLNQLCGLALDIFNRPAPILDRESFPKTVGVAVESGFGKSCLDLTVMCLGRLAVNAWIYEEGGFALADQSKTRKPLLADGPLF